MCALLDDLTEAQREVVVHVGGPLLVRGGAGTGKTRALIARVQWLVEQGETPEHVLVLAATATAAQELRIQLEDSLTHGYEELSVHTVPDLCERLLRSEALHAGLDPFFVTATRADRVAMLLERVEELSLARHDFSGRPSALMASFVERIDALKEQLVDAEQYAAQHAECAVDAERAHEFAQLYRDHDRMLSDRATPDSGELLIRACRVLEQSADVRGRVAERYRHVLVDDFQDASVAAVRLVELLAQEHGQVVLAGDEHQAIEARASAASDNLSDFQQRRPDAQLVRLSEGFRCAPRIQAVADAVAQAKHQAPAAGEGEVEFWRCANELTQAQSVAADIERLIGREGVQPQQIAVLVGQVSSDGQAVAVATALQERAIPHRVLGATAFFERAEVRDVLAWMRLLIDPGDAAAVVRALARPPIELRQVDLVRVIQISRRRKLDMVSALRAATESPQIPPEARERVLSFLKLHRDAAAALDTARPDLFVHRLIERMGLRRQQLFAAQTDVVERLVNLARLGELAAGFARRAPQSSARELAGYLAAVSEAGLPAPEAVAERSPRAVRVMSMQAARGAEFEHVYVCGLQSARMPGASRQDKGADVDLPIQVVLRARTRARAAPSKISQQHPRTPPPKQTATGTSEQLADEDLDGTSGGTAPESGRAAHVARMRNLLYVAVTRARRRLVLAYPACGEDGAVWQPSPFVEEARAAVGGEWEEREEELFGPAETLHATLRMMREEVLASVGRIGGRLGELRLDTDLDISHGVVRYLELVKLAALLERPAEQSVGEALTDVNARLLAAATSLQREIYETSPLDQTLLAAEHDDRRRAQAIAARDEPSLEPFLPRRGEGLVLSASDIETYRSCPLKYKFARVFRIPSEPTLNQRFGIAVHQVLERFHSTAEQSLTELLDLLDAAWRRGGFSESDQERQLREKARGALVRYHERLTAEPAEPVWFERAFSFKLGPHHLRGRVDRVDRLPGGGYELIDYKTGRPKTVAQLKEDVQLSLYALGAREAWQLEAAQQSYYYVLDDQKVQVPRAEADAEWITDTVREVGEGILGQEFEPTPSPPVCAMCDYRIVCPAAEK
ncbi:MAG TPA: ATP-dependent DNA helicase [Solirubrobacteraceae bacterium]|nr:ATP-dependent DNA helicase [Solirubrobacteraceae bacterium]